MNTEKLLDMLKKKLDTVEFAAKEKSIKLIEDIYTSSEKTQIEKWKNDRNFLYSLVKRNAPFSTIIDLSGITLSSQKERNVVHTTSIVVNRNYLDKAFYNNVIRRNFGAIFLDTEKIYIIRIIRNRRRVSEGYKIENGTHLYRIMQYKEFF